MWQIINNTPFACGQTWLRGLDGAETWIVVVKASFDILPDGSTEVSREQPPVVRSPVYHGEPGASSIRYDNEFVLAKTTTDVIVNGQAHAPGGQPATTVDIGFRVGPLSKVLRVHGDREWGTSAAWMTPARPFVTMPVRYERAFGGADAVADGASANWSTANPVGAGFAGSRVSAEARPVANIEYPDEAIKAWSDRPRPAGFGFVAPHWDERARFAGTYDTTWEQTRQPLPPDDFDLRHCQGAPADQQTPAFLTGGEPVSVIHMTPGGRLQFTLPVVELAMRTRFGEDEPVLDHPAPLLHTVIIEPDVPRVSLVWHSAVACHAQVHRLDHTRISLRHLQKSVDEEDVEALFGI